MHIPPNWGTFAALIVSFLVFWFIFGRIFFGPFLKLLSQREHRFKDLSERTEQLLRQARAADEERERRIASATREAVTRREAERHNAEAEAARMIDEAKAESRAALEQARTRIDAQLKAAERELEAIGRNLARELATRVLGRSLNGLSDGGK